MAIRSTDSQVISDSQESARSAFTLRSVLVGLVMAIWVPFWPTYTSLILHSTRADHAHLSMAMLIPYCLLLVINIFLERRNVGFSHSELITICCMGVVGACMHGEWLSVWLLEMLTMPYYFASPENRFAELVLPHMPSWTTVADRYAVSGFYEGLLPGSPFPWAHWIAPLFWWGTFLGSILIINLCLSVLLRKQWMEHERLAFPVSTALLELTGVSGTRGTLVNLARNRLFQLGFGITLAIILWNVITWFTVSMPMTPILSGRHSRHVIPIGTGFPNFIFTFVMLTFVLGYFTNLEVLFSLWFFHGLAVVQAGLFNRFGLDMGSADPWSSSHPAIGWQTFGGMIVFVLWGLWLARAHLKDVFRKAFFNDQSVDDSEELMSYRTTVFLLLGCSSFIMLWLHQAGMNWGPILAFCFATLVLYLGLARILAESGLVYLRVPITAQSFTWHFFGIAGLGPASAVVLTLTNVFVGDGKAFAITQMTQVPRLGMAMKRESRRTLAPAILIGCGIGAATVLAFIIYQGFYGIGSYNFGTSAFKGIGSLNAVGFSRLAVTRIQDGTSGTDWYRILFLGIGAVVMLVLAYLRYQFPGFPLHPIGYTICGMVEIQDNVSTIFIIWFIKSLIIRMGGLERFHRTAPLFLGMMMGYIAGVAVGVVVDFVWFPGMGHEIHADP